MSVEAPALSGPTIASTPASSAEGLSSATFSASEAVSPATISLTQVTIAYSPEMDAGTVVAESPVEIAPAAVLQMPIYQPGVPSQAEISADDSARLAAARAELSQFSAPVIADVGENITREVLQSPDTTLSQAEEGEGFTSEALAQPEREDTAVIEEKGDLSDTSKERDVESIDNPESEQSDVEREDARVENNANEEGKENRQDETGEETDEVSGDEAEETDKENEQTDEETKDTEDESEDSIDEEKDDEEKDPQEPPETPTAQPVVSNKIVGRIALVREIIVDEAIRNKGVVSGAEVGRRFASIASDNNELVSGIVQQSPMETKVPDSQSSGGIDMTIGSIENALAKQGQTNGQTLFVAAVAANQDYVPVDMGLSGSGSLASEEQVAKVVGGATPLRRAA